MQYPGLILDLMTLCWSHDPKERPYAADIVTLANSPEFCHLQDAVSMSKDLEVICAESVPILPKGEELVGK